MAKLCSRGTRLPESASRRSLEAEETYREWFLLLSLSTELLRQTGDLSAALSH